MMEMEGKVEYQKKVKKSGEKVLVWQNIPSTSHFDFFTAVPCGVCTVFSDCREGGVISPETCPYMKKWLDLDF